MKWCARNVVGRFPDPRPSQRVAAVLIALALFAGCEPPLRIGADPAPGPQGSSGDPIYRYTDGSGRPAFTDDPSRVPPERRDTLAPVDLSHVSLNRELGNAISAEVEQAHARLADSEHCERAREAAGRGPMRDAWDRHGHWIAVGGLILFLLVTAPFVMRRVGAPRWGRVLLFVIPTLVLVGLMAHVAVETRRFREQIRESAELCDPDAVQAVRSGRVASPARWRKRLEEELRRAANRSTERGVSPAVGAH